MTKEIRVAGCDCGKSNLYVCVLTEKPKDLKTFSRKYKPVKLYASHEGIAELIKIDADCYVLEPTGSYSYIWLEQLQKAGKDVRLVSAARVRHFCKYQGILNKADRPDAAAIAAYSLENYANPAAFLTTDRFRIRELYLSLNSTIRSRNPIQNRLGQRLGYECPELVKTYEDCYREWLHEKPPAVMREIAGEETKDNYAKRRRQKIDATIGRGLSPHTQALAAQLCNFHRIELQIEKEIAEELAKPQFKPYERVFNRFKMPPKTQAAVLSRIYPFESFLHPETKRPIKEYIYGENSKRKSQMTKRDRSEAAFKLSLGMGKVLHQSGSKTEWKAGGAKYARTALWLYVKSVIVIQRKRKGEHQSELQTQIDAAIKTLGKADVSHWLNAELSKAVAIATNTTPQVAALRLHYEFMSEHKKGDRRISATAGRFCRMLYKELLREL